MAPGSTRPWLSSLAADVLFAADRPQGGPTDNASRINELHAASDFGAWQLGCSARRSSAGGSVTASGPMTWCNKSAVARCCRRPPRGARYCKLEHFGAEQAATLVWVNPKHAGEPDNEQRGAEESALAARWYTRQGAADWHVFGRWGEHTHASVGAALAFVATDELELHASARALQRHDGWQIEPQAGNGPVTTNPWAQATLGRTSQWLLGGSLDPPATTEPAGGILVRRQHAQR